MKPTNLVKLLMSLSLVITMLACKKATTSPSSPTSPPKTGPATTNSMTAHLRAGQYKMIASSVPAEMDQEVTLTLSYRNYKYYSADTNQKIFLYTIHNNVDNTPYGNVRVSKSNIYENEGLNRSLPYIEVYQDTIKGGFHDSSKMGLVKYSLLKGDTLQLKFFMYKESRDITCLYRKQ